MRSIISSTLLCASLLACGQKSSDKPADKDKTAAASTGTSSENAPKPAKDLKELFTGTAPTLPAPIAAVKLGESEDVNKAAVPALFTDRLMHAEEWPDVTFGAYADKDTKIVSNVSVNIPKAKARQVVEAAWGPGKDAKDTIDRPQVYWFNPATGLRAVLEEGFGDDVTLSFTRYAPLTQFIGDQKGTPFGFETPKPILGATLDELKAAYGKQVETETAEQAQKKQDEVGKFANVDTGALGPAQANAKLVLLPTDWAAHWTWVNLDFDGDKVKRYRFSLEFEAYPGAKDAIFALLKAKLGEPKEFEDIGQKAFKFADAPGVVVSEDTITHAWDIAVEAPQKGRK